MDSEWLKRAAEAEDAAGSISVGGLAFDMGWLTSPRVGDVWLHESGDRRLVILVAEKCLNYTIPPSTRKWTAFTTMFVEKCRLVERNGEAVS
jgi:hypothetical protein